MSYRCGAIAALFAVAAACQQPVGVLPSGSWLITQTVLYGEEDGVYFAVWLSDAYKLTGAPRLYGSPAASLPVRLGRG